MNNPLRKFLKSLIGLLLLGCAQTSYALQLDSERMQMIAKGEIPWQSLSPEEQRELKEYRGRWNNYDSEKQNKIRKGTQRYLDLPPERREKIKQQRKHYQELSPEEQQRLREEYRRKHR